MPKPLFPEADLDFAESAQVFSTSIARDPERYFLSHEDARRITRAAECFCKAHRVASAKVTRTAISIMEKRTAREDAERIMRKYANLIRPNEQISTIDKFALRIYERPTKLRERKCPKKPPGLEYLRAIDACASSAGQHVLRFWAASDASPQAKLKAVAASAAGKRGKRRCKGATASRTRAKPAGAVRVELYVGLVADGEPLPEHPFELPGGRAWYVRSFTSNPIEVEFPVPPVPMLIVYWIRWADATGEVGPFSATCRARAEGGFAAAAALPDPRVATRRRPKYSITRVERPQRALEQIGSEAPLKQLPEAA